MELPPVPPPDSAVWPLSSGELGTPELPGIPAFPAGHGDGQLTEKGSVDRVLSEVLLAALQPSAPFLSHVEPALP